MQGDAYMVAIRSDAIDSLRAIDGKIGLNAARAINRTIQRARTAASRGIREQVALPARYLGREDRLGITKRATETDLSAVITGRHRPTSLARFAKNARRSGQTGARVEIQPGTVRVLPRAFFINLRSGSDGSNNNLGLAIRLPAGSRPSRAYKPKMLGPNLWLLYGPSIDQVFDDVAEEIAPEQADFLEREFLRLTEVDLA